MSNTILLRKDQKFPQLKKSPSPPDRTELKVDLKFIQVIAEQFNLKPIKISLQKY